MRLFVDSSLPVVEYRELLTRTRGRSNLSQHLAVFGGRKRALIHVFTVFPPGEIEVTRAVPGDQARPPGWPDRARGGMILTVKSGVANRALVAKRYGEPLASVRCQA